MGGGGSSGPPCKASVYDQSFYEYHAKLSYGILLNRMTLLCSEGLNCDGNMREEPKHIVFLSKILALFSICFMCKADSPMVVAKQKGTMLFVTAACKCGEVFKWRSQPDLPGTKIPAGNILLSMGILCAGGSFTKFKTVCSHIGLACISRATYFSHQKVRSCINFGSIYLGCYSTVYN